jgi:uncharacterized protein (DUF1697 family)
MLAGKGNDMPTWVALLHSITIAGGRRLVMNDLRNLALELGFERPETLLATGNLIFDTGAHDARARDARAIELRLEPAFAEAFGRTVPIIVRAAADWPALVAANPFPEASEHEPARVSVRVMRAPADAAVAERLAPYRTGAERLAIVDGDLWVHLPDGVAGSRLATAVTPKRAGGAGTFRNWNTIRRIAAALDARAAAQDLPA